MGERRNTELMLLIAGAIPVFLLYAMYLAQQGAQLALASFTVPICLTVAFAAAHVAIRFFSPGADPAILPIVFVLSGIGITFVTRLDPAVSGKQIVWLFVSIAAMVAVLVAVRDLEGLARYKYTLGILGLALLLLPAVVGTEVYGSKLWIMVGGLSFQPGEVAKVLVVIFLASFLSSNREVLSIANRNVLGMNVPRLRMLLPLLCMWLISLGIVIFERDLGSAALMFVIFVIMLYAATGRWFYIVVSGLLLCIGAAIAYVCFAHVRTRVQIWIDPFADAQGSGLQIVQTLFSLADGGLLGCGIGKGMCGTIPFVRSDFIFAAIGEEMGLLGAAAVLLLFMLFTVRGFLTAARARSDMAAFMAIGLTSSISFQAFLIIGGVTRLIPLTGVTLPFMSQGGSSLLASFIIVGLLLRCGDAGTGTQAEIAGNGVSDVRRSKAGIHLSLETPESGVLGRRALSKRLTVLTALFTGLFAILIANLTWIMFVQAPELRAMDTNGHTLARQASSQRGSILTSDGVTLAQSVRQEDGTYARVYPQGAMAAHTVGYSSVRYGKTGIEALYDTTLSASQSLATWAQALSTITGQSSPGNDVILTINSAIQAAAEAALAGHRGAIVVLDPKTGAVLAKASAPSYSNDQLDSIFQGIGVDGQLFDRTVQALYTPGSTFKIVTLAAALDLGVADLDSLYGAPAELEIGGGTVTNYAGGDYGIVDLRRAFAISSNTVFAQVAGQIGPDVLVAAARSFGYGKSTGLGFTATASLMPDPAEMTEWETAWAGVGQPVGEHQSPAGPQTTVMQNAMVVAAIANGGVLMEPHIVQSVTSSAGATLSVTQPRVLGQACSPTAAALVGDAMLLTVSEGTGVAAAIPGVDVAGKTGTAETGAETPNAWFVGYAPYDNPAVAIAVVIENDSDHTATAVAGDVLQVALEVVGGGS